MNTTVSKPTNPMPPELLELLLLISFTPSKGPRSYPVRHAGRFGKDGATPRPSEGEKNGRDGRNRRALVGEESHNDCGYNRRTKNDQADSAVAGVAGCVAAVG